MDVEVVELSKESRNDEKLQTVLMWIGLFLVPILLLGIYFRIMFTGLINVSAFDFAQVGRNMSNGQGFTTYVLRPLALSHGSNPLAQPDLTHGPLYPLVLSLVFAVLGAKDSVVALTSGFFYVISTPLVYLLATRIFDRRVGLITATTFAANNLMLEYATSGLHITFYTFLTSALMLVFHSILERSRNETPLHKGEVFLCGVLTGALYLTDFLFSWVLIVPLIMFLFHFKKQRSQFLPLFLAPLLLLIVPLFIRNFQLTGNPVFGLRGIEVWANTKGYYPVSHVYRMLPGDLTQSVGLFKAVFNKIIFGSGVIVQAFPQVSASWMLAFLLPSLLYRFVNPTTNIIRSTMMFMLFMIMIGTLLFGVEMPYFVGLIPMMLAFSIAYMNHLIQEVQLSRNAILRLVLFMLVALSLPITSDLFVREKTKLSPDIPTARILKTNTEKNTVILSDSPWIVAWYGERPSIWIPVVDANLRTFQKQFQSFNTIFLTEEVRFESTEWQILYNTFRQWNEQTNQAVQAKQTPPALLTIDGSAFPLLEILKGYTTVPRTEKMSVTSAWLSLAK